MTEAGADHPHHPALRLKKNRAAPLRSLWVFMAFSRVELTFIFTASGHFTVIIRLDNMKFYYFRTWKTQDKRRKIPVNISLGNLNGRYRVAWFYLVWNVIGLRTLADTEIKFGFSCRRIFFNRRNFSLLRSVLHSSNFHYIYISVIHYYYYYYITVITLCVFTTF